MLNSMHEGDGASTKTLGKKVFFIVKMTGPAIVRPVSSDFWKAPCQRLSRKSRLRSGSRLSLFQAPR